jgi:D-sedoheptulose 7-phosphate isomerase
MSYFRDYFLESSKVLSECSQNVKKVESLAQTVWKTLQQGGSIYWMGNGGSASDAEHLAAELAGRFKHDRRPLSSYALTVNSSLITAIANDYGYEQVFSRQVSAYLTPNDVIIGISTSGKSINVLSALKVAKEIGAVTCILTGRKIDFDVHYDFVLNVNSSETCHIQEAHIAIGQALCGFIEEKVVLEKYVND